MVNPPFTPVGRQVPKLLAFGSCEIRCTSRYAGSVVVVLPNYSRNKKGLNSELQQSGRLQRSHGWCFARHSVDGSVLLGTPSGGDKPIAVGFDTAIVKAAWTIVHQRSTAEEKFLIVMKDSQE